MGLGLATNLTVGCSIKNNFTLLGQLWPLLLWHKVILTTYLPRWSNLWGIFTTIHMTDDRINVNVNICLKCIGIAFIKHSMDCVIWGMIKKLRDVHMGRLYINTYIYIYRQTSNKSRTLVGSKIVDYSDVVGTSPVDAALYMTSDLCLAEAGFKMLWEVSLIFPVHRPYGYPWIGVMIYNMT